MEGSIRAAGLRYTAMRVNFFARRWSDHLADVSADHTVECKGACPTYELVRLGVRGVVRE